MRRTHAAATLAFLLTDTSLAAADSAPWRPAWSTGKLTTTLTGNVAYDTNHATSGSTLDPHSQAVRRREIGFRMAVPGAWDTFVYYDAQARRWFDVTWRAQSRWLFGRDIGTFRLGHSRVPFGFESITASRHRSFIEFPLPWQAFFQNRRTGIDWALHRQHAIVEVGYYFAGDLQGDNDGRTLAAHLAWVPIHQERRVLHLGASASVENPTAWTDGLGQRKRPSARWRARPEAGLTEIRLVDTGAIANTRQINRQGVEVVWIEGPWSMQGEYIDVGVSRFGGKPIDVHGYYVFASFVVTGESRRYVRGQVTDVVPRRSGGAVEVLARQSAIDLNGGSIRGGRQQALTFGINWYLGRHLKFQYNHVRTTANRQGSRMNLAINELQAQFHF